MGVSYNRLWKMLIDKNMKRIEMQYPTGISGNILARMGKNQYVSLETIEKICKKRGAQGGMEGNMSKYHALWAYIQKSDKQQLTLTFDEIGQIAEVTLDHSFLKYKKELSDFGYEVGKISMKNQTVVFIKKEKS